MNKHALVSHQVNDEVKMAYVPYDDTPFQGRVVDKIIAKSKNMKLKSPVHILETGSGKRIYERLY